MTNPTVTSATDPGASAVGQSSVPSGAAEISASPVGQRLRMAREARSLSIGDVSQALKLGPKQVEALEAENWSALPGNTMIRGFVRNYARLLNLDSEPLMRELDAAHLERTLQLDVSSGTTATLPQSSRRAQRRDWLAVWGGLLMLAVALLAYFYVPADIWSKLGVLGTNKQSNVSLPAATAVEQVPNRPMAETKNSSVSGNEATTPVAPPNAVVLADQAPSPPPPSESTSAVAGTGGLKFSFVKDAWLEVRDATGKLLVNELCAGGSQREVTGQPPFALVVGNATEVRLEYRGRPVDLSPINKGVARLSVE
ncbi:MAG: helix-turn-helix domain-containing protein [Candidatus Accumulibacter sp.]|nr:helix-turn-helix domain-containing protein [Accumulibacter sp.]